MLNVSNKDAWSINKTLFRSAINNRNKELRHISKELSISKNVISKRYITLSTTDFYILEKSITSHNKKSLQKSLYTYRKEKLSSLTRGCTLPIFTANENMTNLMQYELSKEETSLLKTGLYFPT